MATGQWWIVWLNTEVSTGQNTGDTYKIIQGTQAQAQAEASKVLSGSVSGPYATQAAARAAAKAGKGSQQQNTNPLTGGVSTTGQVNSIEAFLQGLTSANLWVRVAKVLIGGVLVIVGVAHLTGLDSKITGTAGKIISNAPLL